MIIVSRKWTRPSTDIKFWQMPVEAAQLFNQRYKDHFGDALNPRI